MALDQRPPAKALVSFPARVVDSPQPGTLTGVPSISEQWIRGCTYRPFYPCIRPLCLQNTIAPVLRPRTRCNRRFLCRDEAYPHRPFTFFRYFAVASLCETIATTRDGSPCRRPRGTQFTLVYPELVGSSRSYSANI